MGGSRRFILLLVATFAVVATVSPATAARRSRSSRGTDAATQFSRAVESARKGQIGSALLAVQSALRKEPLNDRYLYLAALLSYKQAQFEPAVSYCSRLLALRTTTTFGEKAASLKTLAEGKLSAGRGSAASASLEAPTVLYSSALENQRRFVDEGLANVAGRVRQSVRGGLDPVDERPVVRTDAYPIVTGQKRLIARAVAVSESRAGDAGTRPAAPPPTPAAAVPTPTAEALAADAANALDAFDFGDALPGSSDEGGSAEPPTAAVPAAPAPSPTPEATPTPTPTPTVAAAAAPAPTPAASQPPPPQPTKAVVKPTSKPATTKPEDDFGDAFAGFGDDSTPPPPAPTKAPTKKPVAKPVAKPVPATTKPEDDFGDAFDGFGDDGAATPPAATKAPAATPAATKAPAAAKDDGDDDFGDAFDGF